MNTTLSKWKQSIQNYKHNKGFTLIELIVVMAIVGILVLIAAPKLLGKTDNAVYTHIQNDIRVAEDKVSELLISEPDTFESWENADLAHLENTMSNNKLLGRGGPVHSLEELPNNIKVLEDEFISTNTRSNLEGVFYTTDNGDVFYEHSKALAGETTEDSSNKNAPNQFFTGPEELFDNDYETGLGLPEVEVITVGLNPHIAGKDISIHSHGTWRSVGAFSSSTRRNRVLFLDEDGNTLRTYNVGGFVHRNGIEQYVSDVNVPEGAIEMKIEIAMDALNDRRWYGSVEEVWLSDELDKEVLSYPKETIDNEELYVGESYIAQEGVDGLATRTYDVTIDDEGVISRMLTSEVIEEPVTEITSAGVKEYSSITGTNFYGAPVLFDGNTETGISQNQENLDRVVVKWDGDMAGKGITIHSHGTWRSVGAFSSSVRRNRVVFLDENGSSLRTYNIGGYEHRDGIVDYVSEVIVPEGAVELYLELAIDSLNDRRWYGSIEEIWWSVDE